MGKFGKVLFKQDTGTVGSLFCEFNCPDRGVAFHSGSIKDQKTREILMAALNGVPLKMKSN